jgi:hypothetical protein
MCYTNNTEGKEPKMPRVNVPEALYKVVLVERERGYGQRVIWTEYYDNEAEARARAEAVSDYSDPEDYYVGEVSRA